MCTTFRTFTDEAAMREMFPGQALYTCADCRKRICLFSDLDATADNGADFVCPQCQQARQDAAKAINGSPSSRPSFDNAHRCTGPTLCPACRAACTPEGAAQITRWNRYADTHNRREVNIPAQ